MVESLSEQLVRSGAQHLVLWRDAASGLEAVLVLDDLTRGPAAGGIRTYDITGVTGSGAIGWLVVVGNQDILTPRGDSEELHERLPTSELVVISGAAHGLMVEHATTFNRVLLDFLGRVSTAATAGGESSLPTAV